MKKITTIAAAGLGLAAIALGAFAMPASAATNTVDSSSSIQSGRLEGIPPLPNGPGGTWYFKKTAEGAPAALTQNISEAATVNTPAVGVLGEVRFDGLCLTRTDIRGGVTHDWETSLEQCDGRAFQQFTVNTDGSIRGEMTAMGISGQWTTNSAGVAGGGLHLVMSFPGLTGWLMDLSSLSPVTAVTPVDISGPAQNEITLRNPTFTGTGDEGAEIVVTDAAGVELCRATVSGGNWSCTTGIDLPDGPLDATATQTATDGTITTDTVSIIVADPLNTPVIDPMLAGGASIALLAAAGAIFAIRRKQNATAAL